jgi:hypothetical protein
MELKIEDILQDLGGKLAENSEKDLIKHYSSCKELILITVREISRRAKSQGFSDLHEQLFIHYNRIHLF